MKIIFGRMVLVLAVCTALGSAHTVEAAVAPPLPDGFFVFSPEAQEAALDHMIRDTGHTSVDYDGQSCEGFAGSSVIVGGDSAICDCPGLPPIPLLPPQLVWHCHRG